MARSNGEARSTRGGNASQYAPSARALDASRRLAVGATLSFFALYVTRLCPALSLQGDSAELVSAAALWGVPHPPGYPLFTAIGHAFAALAVNSIPWRVHLTSAVFHACTVGVVCMLTFTLTRSLTGAFAAAWALGMSRTFLLGSLYAEVFPLNDLFFACLMALGLRAAAAPRDEAHKRLVAFSICAGLAVSHHLMIVLGAPALAMLVAAPMWRSVRERRKRAAALVLALLAPLLVYALIPLAASRSPALSWGDVHDWRSLLRLVMRQDYGGPFSPTRTPSLEPRLERLAAFGWLLAKSMGAISIALAVIGLGQELRRERWGGTSLLLAIVVPGPLFAWINALGTGSEATLAYFERFTSMCHVPLAIAAGSGAALLQSALGGKRGATLAFGLALGLWVVHAARRTRDVDLSHDWRGIAFAHDLVLGTPDRSLVLLSGDEPGNAALYVCAVERACGARIVLSPGSLFLPWRMSQVRARHPDLDIPWAGGPALHRAHELAAAALGSRPVFVYPSLFEKDPDLKADFTSLPDRLLFRLWPAATPIEVEQAALVASARAMSTGSPGCEGCSITDPIAPRPSQDVEIVEAYEAAFVNAARSAREVPRAGDLAATLRASARQLSSVQAQGGWLSRSR
jgi:hypothetical protein